jgi:hypothetical protein
MNIILDSNLLLLWIVGVASQKYIYMHRRLREYSIEDFVLLKKILSSADRIVVTPNILTETSNLAGYIAEPARMHIYQMLRALIDGPLEEQHIVSKQAVARDEFLCIGLTDSAILEMATSSHVLLTVDLDLYLAALRHGIKAENFNHRRAL